MLLVRRRRCSPLFASLLAALVIFIIVAAAFIREVRRPFVFMRAAIVLEPSHNLVDVRGRVLVQLLIVPEDDDGDVDRAEDGKLVRFLEQTAFALEEGHGSDRSQSECCAWSCDDIVPVPVISDGLDLSSLLACVGNEGVLR